MRGTLTRRRQHLVIRRIIPAHAGNSQARTAPSAMRSDHPRACGELCYHVIRLAVDYGSSPRMRGTRAPGHFVFVCPRIIPAHAGNSCRTDGWKAGRPDHPRACGELQLTLKLFDLDLGSSPRMRGTHPRTPYLGCWGRIIPAHAGNSISKQATARKHTDHPRACGELSILTSTSVRCAGSSPRMRGTLRLDLGELRRDRIIPAHAGNSGVSGASVM